jgi:hypothetical protein
MVAGALLLMDDDDGDWPALSPGNTAQERPSFTLECDGRPILALAAASLLAARRLCGKAWFKQELRNYRSAGLPVWDGKGALTTRGATLVEHEQVLLADSTNAARNEDTSLYSHFLYRSIQISIDRGLRNRPMMPKNTFEPMSVETEPILFISCNI